MRKHRIFKSREPQGAKELINNKLIRIGVGDSSCLVSPFLMDLLKMASEIVTDEEDIRIMNSVQPIQGTIFELMKKRHSTKGSVK